MSKNFEQEYKEYLNAQAPNLWGRIEAGIDAVETGDTPDSDSNENIVVMSGREKRVSKKKQSMKYRRYKLVASVAACLFALCMIVPVYMLVAPKGSSESADMATPIVLEDTTIENSVVTSEETTQESVQVQESAVTQVADGSSATTDEVVVTDKADTEAIFSEESSGAPAETDDKEAESDVAVAESDKLAMNNEEDSEGNTLSEEGSQLSMSEVTMLVMIQSEGESCEAGVIYAALKLNDTEAGNMKLLAPKESNIVLENGKNYLVKMTYSADNDYYILVEATVQ